MRSNGWPNGECVLNAPMTLVMNEFAALAPVPITTPDRPANDCPDCSWNTRTSVLSHETGPSTMYGFGCVIRSITAVPDVEWVVAVSATGMSSAVNPFVFVNTTWYTNVKRCGCAGSDGSSATSALGRIEKPVGVGDSVNVGAHDCNCAGVGFVVVMPRSVGVKPSTVT